MDVAQTIDSAMSFIKTARTRGKTIGFVPTMGALHIGHVSLIKQAKMHTDYVVVSIYVNPSQFGPTEDFEKYPRPFEDDLKICETNGVDLVFAPKSNQMYPAENLTWVDVEKLTEFLCGSYRPGHFRGVTTVCTKLFNIVTPDVAFFGQKDAQQTIVIKQMVSDLNMPLKIVVCPTVREPDDLAVSSRNKYLTQKERQDAALIYKSLQKACQLTDSGIKDSDTIISEMKKVLWQSPLLKIEYISIVDIKTLQNLSQIQNKALIALAVKVASARLIDNIMIDISR